MDRTELITGLDGFKQACSKIDCINLANKNALDLEDAYPGAEPASYIIDITVKQEWLDKGRSVTALRELIDLFYETVDAKTRENILTLRICGVDDEYLITQSQPKIAA